MFQRSDVSEGRVGQAGVVLVHLPTGCSIEVNASSVKETNRTVALRLLQARVNQFDMISKNRI